MPEETATTTLGQYQTRREADLVLHRFASLLRTEYNMVTDAYEHTAPSGEKRALVVERSQTREGWWAIVIRPIGLDGHKKEESKDAR